MIILEMFFKALFKFPKYRFTTMRFEDGVILWGITTDKFTEDIIKISKKKNV